MTKFKELFEAKDMTRQYDGFYVVDMSTGKTTKYPYIKGKNHKDVEQAAFREQRKLTKNPKGSFLVHGFVPKGEYKTHKAK